MKSALYRWSRQPRWLIAALVLGLGVATTAALVASPPAESAVSRGDATASAIAGPVSFADVVERVSPAVVNIAVKKLGPRSTAAMSGFPESGTPFDEFLGRFFDLPGMEQAPRPEPSEALGSGFVIDPDGYIVTNHHVVEGAQDVVVRFPDGVELDADIVGQDAKTDLALLKVDSDAPLPFVPFGNSDRARVGDWVLAIGNPFGLGGSATAGIISARGRDIHSGPYDDYLQIDAPINSGNSGGPVFNTAGEVIGVNTAIFSPNGGNIGIGFAIPAQQAASVIAALMKDGTVTRGWLGVQIQGIDDDLANALGIGDTRGALVAEVVPGSPADAAGVQAGDVLTRFNGQAIEDPRHLSRLVANARPGDDVDLGVLRSGHEREIDVELGNADVSTAARVSPARADNEAAAGGVTLGPLTAEQKARLGVPETTHGVLVLDVEPGSPAAEKGIRPGDIITAVDHRDVSSVPEALAALHDSSSHDGPALLLVRHGDTQRYVALSLS